MNSNLFRNLEKAIVLSEKLHTGSTEQEEFQLFKPLNVTEKEEQIQERCTDNPSICTSPEFAFQGLPKFLEGLQQKEQAAKAEDYDPTKDEREMGLFMNYYSDYSAEVFGKTPKRPCRFCDVLRTNPELHERICKKNKINE